MNKLFPLLLLVVPLSAQTRTIYNPFPPPPGLSTVLAPLGTGTTDPAVCTPGITANFVNTTASPATEKACLAANTWTAITTGGGSGTVTSVSVVTANGVSGSVATATTTPAITLTLGAITPSSVVSPGAVTGASLNALPGSITVSPVSSITTNASYGATNLDNRLEFLGSSTYHLGYVGAGFDPATGTDGYLAFGTGNTGGAVERLRLTATTATFTGIAQFNSNSNSAVLALAPRNTNAGSSSYTVVNIGNDANAGAFQVAVDSAANTTYGSGSDSLLLANSGGMTLRTATAKAMTFWTNNTLALTLSSAQAATFAGTVVTGSTFITGATVLVPLKTSNTGAQNLALLAAGIAALPSSTGTVFLGGGCGSFPLDNTAAAISITTNVVIWGQGLNCTTLTKTSQANALFSVTGLVGGHLTYWGFRDLTMSGGSSGAGDGLSYQYADYGLIENVRFTAMGGNGVVGNSSAHVSFLNGGSDANGGAGFLASSGGAASGIVSHEFRNFNVYTNASHGYDIEAAWYSLIISGGQQSSNTLDGVYINHNGESLDYTPHSENNNSSHYDIEFNASADGVIHGGFFNSGTAAAIRINSGKFVRLTVDGSPSIGSPTYFIDNQSCGNGAISAFSNNLSGWGLANRCGSSIGATGVELGLAPPPVQTVTDAATISWTWGGQSLGNATLLFTVHSGSRTFNQTGLIAGGNYAMTIQQDGTGGEGLTLGSGCTWKVGGSGGGAITPSTGANAIDLLTWYYDGTNCYANFNKTFN